MMILLVVLLLVLLASTLGYKILWGSLAQPKDLMAGIESLRPVNPKSLSQLLSSEQDAFLKSRLPAAKYRALRRQKLQVLRSYYQTALKNCDILQAASQRLREGGDLESRVFGEKLADAALSLRIQLLRALLWAHLCSVFPYLGVDVAGLSKTYVAIASELEALSASRTAVVQRLIEQAFAL